MPNNYSPSLAQKLAVGAAALGIATTGVTAIIHADDVELCPKPSGACQTLTSAEYAELKSDLTLKASQAISGTRPMTFDELHLYNAVLNATVQQTPLVITPGEDGHITKPEVVRQTVEFLNETN